MKNGLIDVRFLFAPSSLARFAAASVEFVPMTASIVRLVQGATTASRTVKASLRKRDPICRLSQANVSAEPRRHRQSRVVGSSAELARPLGFWEDAEDQRRAIAISSSRYFGQS